MKPTVIRQNAGIDVSKDDFKVCLYQLLADQRQRIKATRTFKNTLTGFKGFLNWAEKHRAPSTVRVTIEATGVYYEQLVHFLHDLTDYHLSVLLPNKSKAFAKSLNVKTKTDSVDAKILGQMGLERNLDRWQPLSPNIRTVKQLCRERVALLDERTALLNKVHALGHAHQPHKEAIKRLRKRIGLANRQLKEVEAQIAQSVNKDGALKERIEKICMVKGLGLITVATIVAETNGFALFTSRSQLTSYAGYDVIQRESGTSIKGKTRISKKGNRYIRRALFFPAISAVRHEPQFQQLYERVLDRTAIKMKGLVAVQRKLLLLIYALFTKNETYDPKYVEKCKVQKSGRQDTVPAYTG